MSKTALVVDDSKSARFALRKSLENHGYKVDAVESAKAAYEALSAALPDIVFLDHIMPEIDGFQALQHIKQDARSAALPVVICSSNEGPSFNDEARGKGATAVLQKPPSPEQLQKVLDSVQAAIAERAAAAPEPVTATAASAEEALAAKPPKVTNIREPEVAIEQAVMKVIRSAIPPRAEGAPPSVVPHIAAPSVPLSNTMSVPLSTTMGGAAQAPAASHGPFMTASLRDQIDERIRKVTQDLFVQVASLRADVVELQVAQSPEDAPWREDVSALRAGLENLQASVAASYEDLRSQVNTQFALQAEQMEQFAQTVRSVAAEEAHRVADRAVMDAAARVSDQLAKSILQALNPMQGQAPRRSEAG